MFPLQAVEVFLHISCTSPEASGNRGTSCPSHRRRCRFSSVIEMSEYKGGFDWIRTTRNRGDLVRRFCVGGQPMGGVMRLTAALLGADVRASTRGVRRAACRSPRESRRRYGPDASHICAAGARRVRMKIVSDSGVVTRCAGVSAASRPARNAGVSPVRTVRRDARRCRRRPGYSL